MLHLAETAVTDLGPLAAVTGLRELSVAGTRVADLSPLHDLPELAEIDLEDTAVDADQAAALRDARPAVRVLGRT